MVYGPEPDPETCVVGSRSTLGTSRRVMGRMSPLQWCRQSFQREDIDPDLHKEGGGTPGHKTSLNQREFSPPLVQDHTIDT